MREPCGDESPEHPGVFCEKPTPCYFVHQNFGMDLDWPGEEPTRHLSRLAEMKAIADAIPREKSTGPPTLVRRDDPATAHEAVARYEPKRETAKARVLAYLQAHLGEWIDAPVFTERQVGSFAGTRRLRELREEGWPIETRPKPGEQNTWQHRLVSEDEDDEEE